MGLLVRIREVCIRGTTSMWGNETKRNHETARASLRPRCAGCRCTTKRGLVWELLELSGSGATHQTGDMSLSDSSEGSKSGGGGCVFAKTVKFAVVSRGSWARLALGAHERTRPLSEMGEAGVELATRDSVAVGEVRAGRGGDAWGLEDAGESEVMQAVGYWGVRMRLEGEA